MSGADWLSYSLQDFVMFGPQVFLRLFVRINQDVWPWLLLAGLIGFAVPVLLVNQKPWAIRLALGLVSAAWIVSGYGFLVTYFGPINWPAEWFGWAFVAQGGLLGLIAIFGSIHPPQTRTDPTAVLWLAVIWTIAILALPWLAVAESGDWKALALFGLAPGTTAAASTLVTGFLPGFWRYAYLVLPLFWSLFSVATFWVLQTWWLLVLPAATLLFTGLGFWLSPRRAQSRG